MDNKIVEDVCIRNSLVEEIARALEEISTLAPGSEERRAATDNLETLYRLKMDEDERVLEYAKLKRAAEDTKKDRLIKIGIAAAELVLPLAFYAVWMHKGLKFEEEGALTSSTFRTLWSHFRPTK